MVDKYHYYQRERDHSNPSFSSTLLDAIYRSIDEGEEELVLHRETMRKKQSPCFKDEEEKANFQRACMIEKWMEKKVTTSEKVGVRRNSMADFERKARSDRDGSYLNSSSSSSDSSCGGVFSSSEADESAYGVSSRSSCYGFQRPKPIRTSISAAQPENYNKRPKDLNMYGDYDRHHSRGRDHYFPQQKQMKNEGGFVKTKSKALKIYGDLKKVKQPLSPGGRLATFLNSLFAAGNAKKAKISSSGGYNHETKSERKLKSANTSTCSSASSFSRSCLSKTPSSGGKSTNGTKRSVRFYPVSVIVDEDCQPCGHKSLYENKPKTESVMRNSISEELKLHLMEKNRRVEEAARELLRNYQKKIEHGHFDHHDHTRNAHMMKNEVFPNEIGDEDLEEEEDEDDAASCASSDLFELDNLSSIGIDRYHEELPVYETTHLGTNRAIANGLML